MKLHFKTGLKRCPECKSKLVICKTYRRTVKSSGYGIFDAVVHTKKCHVHGLFGPEQLSNIVSPHCTYANDIMVDAITEMMLNDSLPDTPYNDKIMDKANEVRNSTTV